MTLSEELAWRGFVNQTTYKNITAIDGRPVTFYWGVDPSATSMTIGHLSIAMMIKHFINHGHKAVLLVGGATGMIGDPDGKSQERTLNSLEEIAANKAALNAQYKQIFGGHDFTIVDNYDWFKDMDYLGFLRDIGKHVPMSQMLSREFVQSRLGTDGSGISYAEFSYALIQGYDFLHLYRELGVRLQLCGADQWGNSLAGVELIRRIDGGEAHVWSAPLIVNKTTGVKFGKSEAGAIWLDSNMTSPTQFYQFWINADDDAVEDYLKIYTELPPAEIEQIMAQHRADPAARYAQTRLAGAITGLVHGHQQTTAAQTITDVLIGARSVAELDGQTLIHMRREVSTIMVVKNASIVETLVKAGLATSNSEARRLLQENAVYINGQKAGRDHFEAPDFQNGRLLLRRGKAYKDSALIELKS